VSYPLLSVHSSSLWASCFVREPPRRPPPLSRLTRREPRRARRATSKRLQRGGRYGRTQALALDDRPRKVEPRRHPRAAARRDERVNRRPRVGERRRRQARPVHARLPRLRQLYGIPAQGFESFPKGAANARRARRVLGVGHGPDRRRKRVASAGALEDGPQQRHGPHGVVAALFRPHHPRRVVDDRVEHRLRDEVVGVGTARQAWQEKGE